MEIPFALLRLRKAIDKKRTPENLVALQKLIQNDNMIAEQQEEIIRLKQQLEELTNKYESVKK